ncbi:MAG: HlyC/CorC family transporter [Chloroflexi bacterium]|nr:HlyC/CorC family transporter [Chloroflexota bacterium]
MDALPNLVAVLLLVLANGFFVASEFALVSVRRSRIEQLVAEGNPLAESVRHALQRLDLYIAATQLGITMASIGLGWVGEPALAHLIEPWLARLPFLPAESREVAAHTTAVAIAFATITALHIVLGELAPKSLALRRSEATALLVARPLSLFLFVFRLPIHLLNSLGNLVVRALGLQPAAGEELVHSADELRLLVIGSREAGVLDETEAEIVSRVLGFAEVTVREVMVPRTELQALPVTASWPQVLHLAATSGHSRFPVYDGDLDQLVGVLHVKDLFKLLEQSNPPEPFDLRRLARSVPVVPDSLPVDSLLVQLQREQRSIAMVVDEFGGIAGLVTLQDVLQRIVGQLGDEFEPARPKIVPQPDGSLLVDGLARIEDVALQCGLRVPEEDTEEVETMGGLVMLHLGRLPAVGDEVVVGGRRLRVEQMDGRRVARIRLLPAANQLPRAARP